MQPAHLHSLINVFVIRLLGSIIPSGIPGVKPFYVAEQTGLCISWMEFTKKTVSHHSFHFSSCYYAHVNCTPLNPTFIEIGVRYSLFCSKT